MIKVHVNNFNKNYLTRLHNLRSLHIIPIASVDRMATHKPIDVLADSDEAAKATDVAENIVLYGGRKASLSIDILIVGCGLGGLAAAHALSHAGHRVTIVEAAHKIGEIGAGIQVTPNLSRLLIRWGLGSHLEAIAVKPEAIALRRYKNGELVGWTRLGDSLTKEHGSPYYHIHRADFHRMLLDLASSRTKLRLSSTVVSLDPSVPSLTLASGEVLKADLIVGADGVKSMIREIVLGEPVKAVPTGDAAYRVIVPTSKMMEHEELRPLVEYPEMTGWMGPRKHVMAYNIRDKREYNIVLIHPDDGSVESWTAEGSADKMRADFAGWDPRLEKLLTMVPYTLKWRIMDRLPLKKWVHKDEKVVLLGDACHPMLPYRAQGSAMAIEDAAVLGNIFSHLSSKEQIGPFLQAYFSLRYTRTAATQASSRLNQNIFHLVDGPEQERRDQSMREAMYIEKSMNSNVSLPEDILKGNANQWADKKKNTDQFSYDADAEADNWWREYGDSLCRHLADRSSRL